MEILIREAEGFDAPALVEYQIRVGGETDNLSFGSDTFRISPEKEERFILKFKTGKRNLMLVALDGDKIVANASVEQNRVERYSHRAEFSITVLKDYWGKGIGSELTQRLIDFSEKAGYRVLYLDVRSDNIRAIALYERFGFERIGTFKDYFNIKGKYYDAELMNLYL